eukprot:m.155478 g.155478  ORF g.155478 m.155478 type:complete len:1131 (-) comp16418_c0_seq1:104-3496(-)
MARFVLLLASLLALGSFSEAAWLSQSGLRCVSLCEVRDNDVTLPIQLTNASVCSIDESLSLSCPYCVDGPSLDGICQGRCIDLCDVSAVAASSKHRLHRRFGFFDDIVSKAGDLFSSFTDEIERQLAALSEGVQELIDQVGGIAKATFGQLAEMGEDLLAQLKDVVSLTAQQVVHLIPRLVKFTTSNLQQFLANMDQLMFKRTLKEFGCEKRWTESNAKLIAGKAIDVLGTVGRYAGVDVEFFQEVGEIVYGIAKGDMELVDDLVFKGAVLGFSILTRIPPSTVEGMANKAKVVFGQVSQWDAEDWRSVGNVAEGLLDGDLEALDDSAALNELARTSAGKDLTKITSIATAGVAIIEGLSDGATEEDWQRIAQFAVGIAADKLRSLPDFPAIRLLGKVPGLNLDQLNALFGRAIDLIGDPSQWNRDAWLDIGQAALAMTGDVIRTISMDGLERLGQLTGLDLDKARAVIDRAVELLGNPKDWSVDNWKALGRAAIAVGEAIIKQLPQSSLSIIAQRLDLNITQLTAIVQRVVVLRGEPGQWEASDLSLLGQAAKALSPSLLSGLSTDAFKVVSTVLGFDVTQLQALKTKAEEVYGKITNWDENTWQELKDLGVQFAIDQANALTAPQLRSLGIGAPVFSPSSVQSLRGAVTRVYGQVSDMTSEDWQDLGHLVKSLATGDLETVSEIGLQYLKDALPDYDARGCPLEPTPCTSVVSVPVLDLDFCPEQLQAIGSRLLVLFGETGNWSDITWDKVGNLARGLSPSDFGQLTMRGLDAVANVACLPPSHMECVVKRAAVLFDPEGNAVGARRRRDITASIAQWSGAEIRRLNQSVAGLNPVMLRNISLSTFDDALAVLSQEYRWNRGQLNVLGDLAQERFGKPEDWDSNLIERLGIILAGLKDEVISLIPAKSLKSVDPLAGQALCDQQRLHVLTPDQLKQVAKEFDCPDQEALFTVSQSRSVAAGREHDKSSGLSTGAIVGIAIAVVLAVIILLVAYRYKDSIVTMGNKPAPSQTPYSHTIQNGAYNSAPVPVSQLMADPTLGYNGASNGYSSNPAQAAPQAFQPARPAPVPRPRPNKGGKPPFDWYHIQDPSTGKWYYANKKTNATSWDKPAGWDQYVAQYGTPSFEALEV